MEAHAEDCILVPPDAEAALPREPIVFEDEDHDNGTREGLHRSSLGERSRFAGECYAGGPKSHVDASGLRHSGGPIPVALPWCVHRYLPEVSGVRIKWALAYLKKHGSMTSSES